MSLVHRRKAVTQETEEQKKVLEQADKQLAILSVMSPAQLVAMESAEDKYVREENAKREAALRADFRANEAKRMAEEKAAQEKAQTDAEWKAQRDRIERQRGDFTPRPVPTDCEVCGGLCLPSVAAHRTNDGLDLCVRDAKRARSAGLISATQYDIIAEEGHLGTGHVFTDCYGDGRYKPTGYEYKETDSTPVNPLAQDREYTPVVHLAGGV